MKRLIIVAALLVSGIVSANAEAKKAIDVGTCGTMWKEHKASADYKDPGKGQRMAAWVEFRRAKCSKTREG